MTTSAVVARYDRDADGYERWWAPVIAPAALRLLDLVEAAVADRSSALVLDIGAGTGTLARAAVTRWPSARAVAVDPSRGMLEAGRAEARRTLPPDGQARLGWEPAHADRLPISDGTADAVVSSFALQHVPSRIAGLREAHRVLRPGGLLAVVTWRAADWDFEPELVIDEVLDELDFDDPPDERPPRPFTSPAAAAALVRRARFGNVRAFAGDVEHSWTPETYLDFELNYGELGILATLDERDRARLEALARERLNRLDPSAFVYRGPVVYVTGRRRPERS